MKFIHIPIRDPQMQGFHGMSKPNTKSGANTFPSVSLKLVILAFSEETFLRLNSRGPKKNEKHLFIYFCILYFVNWKNVCLLWSTFKHIFRNVFKHIGNICAFFS